MEDRQSARGRQAAYQRREEEPARGRHAIYQRKTILLNIPEEETGVYYMTTDSIAEEENQSTTGRQRVYQRKKEESTRGRKRSLPEEERGVYQRKTSSLSDEKIDMATLSTSSTLSDKKCPQKYTLSHKNFAKGIHYPLFQEL